MRMILTSVLALKGRKAEAMHFQSIVKYWCVSAILNRHLLYRSAYFGILVIIIMYF